MRKEAFRNLGNTTLLVLLILGREFPSIPSPANQDLALMIRDLFVLMVALLSSSTAMAGGENVSIEPGIARDIGKTLEGRKVAPPPLRTRGNDLEGLYRASVCNVAVILTKGGLGSSAVIAVNRLRVFAFHCHGRRARPSARLETVLAARR